MGLVGECSLRRCRLVFVTGYPAVCRIIVRHGPTGYCILTLKNPAHATGSLLSFPNDNQFQDRLWQFRQSPYSMQR